MERGSDRGRKDQLKDTEEIFILVKCIVGRVHVDKKTYAGERRDV